MYLGRTDVHGGSAVTFCNFSRFSQISVLSGGDCHIDALFNQALKILKPDPPMIGNSVATGLVARACRHLRTAAGPGFAEVTDLVFEGQGLSRPYFGPVSFVRFSYARSADRQSLLSRSLPHPSHILSPRWVRA